MGVGIYLQYIILLGVKVFLFLANENKCASQWCFYSVIYVPPLLGHASHAQKALVLHSPDRPNAGVLIQETWNLRQAYG